MMDALAIHRALLAWETVHEIVRLPSAIGGADELPRALGLPAERCLATRVHSCDGHRGTGRFLAGVIVPAGECPPADAVRRAAGARHVRPARPDVINAATEYAADLVCPLLLPDTMRLLIDRRLVDALPPDEVVYTPTGEASTALGIRARSLYELCGAEPVDLSAPRVETAPRVEHTRRDAPAGPVRHAGRRGEPNTPGPRHPVVG